MNSPEEPAFAAEPLADAKSLAEMTTDDSSKTRADLIGELARLRHRVADLENGIVGERVRSGGAASLERGGFGQKTTAWCPVNAKDRESAALKATDPSPTSAALLGDKDKGLLHEILAGAPVMVWAVDRDGKLMLAEGKRLSALGLEPGAEVGRSGDELFAELPQIPSDTRRALAGESFTSTIEVDGTVLASSYSPFRDAAGRIVGAVGIAIDLTEHQSTEQEETARRRLKEDVLRSQEWDRRLVAYEIHDGLVQEATGAQMHLEAALEIGQVPPGPARDQIELALELVRRAVSEGRRLISGLRLPVLEQSGVVAAIECLIKEQPQDGPSIEFIADVQFERLEALLETTIYRIAQEAITNVRRHSKSDRAEIRLSQKNDRIQIEIRDWGVGFDPAHIERERLGLEGIRERARLLRGRAEIDSAPGEGTRVFVDLPLAYPAGEAAITNDRSTE